MCRRVGLPLACSDNTNPEHGLVQRFLNNRCFNLFFTVYTKECKKILLLVCFERRGQYPSDLFEGASDGLGSVRRVDESNSGNCMQACGNPAVAAGFDI